MTIEELAQKTNTSVSLIVGLQNGMISPIYLVNRNKYKQGDIKPVVKKICEYLSVDIEDIFPRYICDISRAKNFLTDEQLTYFLHNSQLSSPNEIFEKKNFLNGLESLLYNLTPRQALIVKLRFGLFGFPEYLLEDIGSLLDITGSRVRQIESEALRALRHPSNSKILKEYWSNEKLIGHFESFDSNSSYNNIIEWSINNLNSFYDGFDMFSYMMLVSTGDWKEKLNTVINNKNEFVRMKIEPEYIIHLMHSPDWAYNIEWIIQNFDNLGMSPKKITSEFLNGNIAELQKRGFEIKHISMLYNTYKPDSLIRLILADYNPKMGKIISGINEFSPDDIMSIIAKGDWANKLRWINTSYDASGLSKKSVVNALNKNNWRMNLQQ